MANYIGRKVALGLAIEKDVRGEVDASPDVFWLRVMNVIHKNEVEYLQSSASLGTVFENSRAEVDKTWGEGGVEAEIDADSLPVVLYSLLGNINTDEIVATEAYEHTFEILQEAERPTLSIFKSEPNKNQVFPFAGPSSLEFSFERGKILDFTLPMLSREAQVSLETPVFTDVPTFRPKDFHIYFAEDIAGLGSAQESLVRTVSLTVNPNLETDDVLGRANHINILNKTFAVEGTIGLLYKDDEYEQLFRDGTPKAMRIKLENTALNLVDGVQATGTLTVADYTGLTGDSVTVGTTTLTEGVDFDAETSDDVTATNIAAAIDALPGFSAVAVTNVVTITVAQAGTAGNSTPLSSTGGADLVVVGFANGANPIHPQVVFDFARVYISGWSEDNARDEIKSQELTLMFAENPAEPDIQFMEARVVNNVADYLS